MDKQIHINHTFYDTGLSSYICRLFAHNQYTNPTPIQYYAIKTGIDKCQQNLVCRSKSGTGKTLAYLGLLFQFMAKMIQLEDKTCCVILLPTRELAVQVYQTFKNILDTVGVVKPMNLSENHVQGVFSNIQVMLTIGGISFEDDRKKYRQKAAHVMISTVGRMFQLVKNNVLILNKDMMLILDQGDKLLDSKDDKFNKVISTLPKTTKWVIFSATYSKKMLEELAKIKKFIYVQTMLKNHELQVIISDNIEEQIKNIDQHLQKFGTQPKNVQQSQIKTKNQQGLTQNVHLDNIKKYQYKLQTQNDSIFDSKMKALKTILSQLNYQKCLIFVQKKSFLQQISQALDQFEHVLIHGSLSQAARFRMMNQINSAKIIVASDLLSRGIDIKLDLVILFDARQTDTFWHRIGRTGRYGRTGIAVSLDTIQDQQWHIYNKKEINDILTDIQCFQKKAWYGGHMTQIGKWGEVDQQKQELNDYKYFDESKIESTVKEISKTENLVKNKLQKCETNKEEIINDQLNFKSKQELQNFIRNRIMKCQKCMDLVKGTTALTGYKFEIFNYISEKNKQGK